MTQLIGWIILNYGFSNILVYGSIFEGARNFIRKISEINIPILSNFFGFLIGILSCMMCCPFWTGVFTALAVYSPTANLYEVNSLYSWFFDGILSSGGVWMINSIIEWFEENRNKK